MRSPKDLQIALPLLMVGLLATAVLAGLCIGGGITAIIWNAVSPTTLQIFGTKVTTGHIGVAFTLIGMASIVAVVRNAYKRALDLAKL
jgi:hypothetical protein